MSDLLTALAPHWPAFALAAYLGLGFWIGLREALATRRQLRAQKVDDSLWPVLALLTVFWPMLLAAKALDWFILAWTVAVIAREERRAQRDGRHV